MVFLTYFMENIYYPNNNQATLKNITAVRNHLVVRKHIFKKLNKRISLLGL